RCPSRLGLLTRCHLRAGGAEMREDLAGFADALLTRGVHQATRCLLESATGDSEGSKRNPGGHPRASSSLRAVSRLQVVRRPDIRCPTIAGPSPALRASPRPVSL